MRSAHWEKLFKKMCIRDSPCWLMNRKTLVLFFRFPPVALFPKSVFLLSIFTRLFPASACCAAARFPFAQAASAAAFSFFVPQAPKNSCAPVHFPLAKPPSLQQSSRLGLFSVYCLSCGKARFPMGFLLIRRQNKQFTLNQAYIFEFLNEFPF